MQIRSGKVKPLGPNPSANRAPPPPHAPTPLPPRGDWDAQPAARHVGGDREPPRERTDQPGRSAARRTGPAESAFAAKRPPTFMCGMGILAMLLLFQSAAVPRIDDSMHFLVPWSLVGEVGGLTFHAALFCALLFPLVIGRLPLPYIVRGLAFLGIGITMFVFALSHMRIAIAEFAFRGHPQISLFLDGSTGALAFSMATLLFPAALYWRSRYTASFASRIAVLVGALVVLSAYFLMTVASGGAGQPPIAALFSNVGDSSQLMADRVSMGLLLVPLAVLPLSALILLPHPRSGIAGLWAWLYVTAIGLVPLVQAGFVSHFSNGGYKYALAPLKVSLMLYAALLVLTVALGHVVGETERLIINLRNRRRNES